MNFCYGILLLILPFKKSLLMQATQQNSHLEFNETLVSDKLSFVKRQI